MKEYIGHRSKIYQQTRGKRFILIPAIKRHLRSVHRGGNFLDVACGIGDFSLLASERNLNYYGFDKSVDMVKRAKEMFPAENFYVASATNFASKFKQKFDVIVISMLLPSLKYQKDITKILKESKKVLRKDGKILIGEPYPNFDGYMQSFLFKSKRVQTKFKGYFTSGAPVNITHKLSTGTIIFHDHHWTWTDYMRSIKEAGLILSDLDECPPGKEAKKAGQHFFDERSLYPSYLLLELRHRYDKGLGNR